MNAAGGINGRQIVLQAVDHKDTAAGGVAACKEVQSNGSFFAAVPEGIEANLTPKLPAYFLMNMNMSYQVTKNVQAFALVQNAFNATYYTYGTFSPTSSIPIAQVPGATDTRSYSIGAPIAAYGGLRLTF